MTAHMLINDAFPPLLLSDTCQRALAWMDVFRLSALPVVHQGRFQGLVHEHELMAVKDPSAPLSESKVALDCVFIYRNQHVYDALRFASRYRCPVVPVLDEDNRYAGLLTMNELIECLADLNAVHAEGAIIELEVNNRDYMLSEIAQLIEANDAGIISLSARPSIDHAKTDITLKVNRVDLTRILASFSRFRYKVTASYHQSAFSEDLRERYDAFMKYLNT